MNSQPYDKRIQFSNGPARECPCRQTSPSTPQAVFPKNDSSESSSTERHCSFCGARPDFTERRHHWLTINILPDDVLLGIFDCYVQAKEEAWYTLVHVCQNWRKLVFASPRRLNLQVVCRPTTPVRELLDVWLSFPIAIQSGCPWPLRGDVANTLAGLEHSNRIRDIYLRNVPASQMGEILAGMYKPFPALTELSLQANCPEVLEGEEEEDFDEAEDAPTINPDLFLGGSAPRLEKLILDYISVPGFPKLLSSATHLVELMLCNISYSISPEAMVTALSTSTRLETLVLLFECHPRYRFWPPRDRRRTRTLFPALTWLKLYCVCEYSDDLLAEIDAPRLRQRMRDRDRNPEWKMLEIDD